MIDPYKSSSKPVASLNVITDRSLKPISIMKRKALALCLCLLGSCTTAGPFVVSISSDGKGNLIIEKAYVRMNAFTGTVTMDESTVHKINIGTAGPSVQIAGPKPKPPKTKQSQGGR